MNSKTKKFLDCDAQLENTAKQLQQNFDAKLIVLQSNNNKNIFPSAQKVLEVICELQKILFAEYFQSNTLRGLRSIQPVIKDLIWQSLYCVHAESGYQQNIIDEQAEEFSRQLLQQLPQIRFLLNTDATAAYNGDPACEVRFLPVLCYPSMLALLYYRIAHVLYQYKIPILPRIITELAHNQTGIDIHPGAQIGESFFIDHGTGVVIGETTIIGHHVKIYHGVTLGAKSFPTDENDNPIKGIKRHPIIGNYVTIYSNAVLLGRISVGDDSVIGGNVWLTESVPNNSQVYQHSKK
ncbi:serine O-acetyltransferase [Gammaproteobacteria bacterium]